MKLAVVADEIGTTLEEQIKSMKLAKIKYIEMRKVNDKYLWEYSREKLKQLNIKARKEWEHGEEFQKMLVEIFRASIKKDKTGFGNILETGQLEPKYISDLIKKENIYCICLGHSNLDKKGIIKLCREHDTDEDWSSKLTDEQLGINADKWVEKNELLKNECPKYGIRYIDTSKNRNKILQQIVTEIDEM